MLRFRFSVFPSATSVSFNSLIVTSCSYIHLAASGCLYIKREIQRGIRIVRLPRFSFSHQILWWGAMYQSALSSALSVLTKLPLSSTARYCPSTVRFHLQKAGCSIGASSPLKLSVPSHGVAYILHGHIVFIGVPLSIRRICAPALQRMSASVTKAVSSSPLALSCKYWPVLLFLNV